MFLRSTKRVSEENLDDCRSFGLGRSMNLGNEHIDHSDLVSATR